MTAPRQYKDFTPRMGIYRVSHLPSGRTLLGHSLHLEGRLNRIRFQLQNGLHPDKVMQADWKADGPAAFSFEVLDEITPKNPGDEPVDDLKELLTLWQEKLNLPPRAAVLAARLTAAQLALLAKQPSSETRAAVAAHPNTPAAVLGRLAAEHPAQVLANPALGLLRLAHPGLLEGWPTEAVLSLVAQPQAPVWLRRYGLAHADARFQVAVAGHPALSAAELEQLARHRVWKVRARVAARPDLSPELLAGLLGDSDYGVRLVLASRPDLSPDTLEQLRRDSSLLVRQAMAQRQG